MEVRFLGVCIKTISICCLKNPILLVMADQVVLRFVDEIEFENKGNGISGTIIPGGK